LSLDPALDAQFPAETLARVTVICGGQRFISPVTAPKGEATDPLSWKALETKFRTATRLIASPTLQDQILDAVNQAHTGDLTMLSARLRDLALGSGP
jgi:2-methylcitrate dehydratase PrpD